MATEEKWADGKLDTLIWPIFRTIINFYSGRYERILVHVYDRFYFFKIIFRQVFFFWLAILYRCISTSVGLHRLCAPTVRKIVYENHEYFGLSNSDMNYYLTVLLTCRRLQNRFVFFFCFHLLIFFFIIIVIFRNMNESDRGGSSSSSCSEVKKKKKKNSGPIICARPNFRRTLLRHRRDTIPTRGNTPSIWRPVANSCKK